MRNLFFILTYKPATPEQILQSVKEELQRSTTLLKMVAPPPQADTYHIRQAINEQIQLNTGVIALTEERI